MLNYSPTVISRPAAGVSVRRAAPLAYRIAHLVLGSALRLVFDFRISGRANLPREGGYIAVANHLNWLDAFAVLLALPVEPQVHIVGWGSVMRARKLAAVIRLTRFGFIAVDRDAELRAARRRAIVNLLRDCVFAGNVVVVFPEGSVGCSEGTLQELYPGFARLSLSTGSPVVPVAISWSRNLWLRKRIDVRIGNPITPDRSTLTEVLKTTRSSLLELMPAYVEPRGPRLFEKRLTRLIPSLTNWTRDDL